jgi:hypothetical protein
MNIQFADRDGLPAVTYYTEAYSNVSPAHYNGYVLPHLLANVKKALPNTSTVRSNYESMELYNQNVSEQVAVRLIHTSYMDVYTAYNNDGLIAFTFIPSFTWKKLRLIEAIRNEDKESWYVKRNKDFGARIDQLTDVLYAKMYKKFVKDAVQAAIYVIDWFGKENCTIRTGDYSSKPATIDAKKLRKEYARN